MRHVQSLIFIMAIVINSMLAQEFGVLWSEEPEVGRTLLAQTADLDYLNSVFEKKHTVPHRKTHYEKKEARMERSHELKEEEQDAKAARSLARHNKKKQESASEQPGVLQKLYDYASTVTSSFRELISMQASEWKLFSFETEQENPSFFSPVYDYLQSFTEDTKRDAAVQEKKDTKDKKKAERLLEAERKKDKRRYEAQARHDVRLVKSLPDERKEKGHRQLLKALRSEEAAYKKKIEQNNAARSKVLEQDAAENEKFVTVLEHEEAKAQDCTAPEGESLLSRAYDHLKTSTINLINSVTDGLATLKERSGGEVALRNELILHEDFEDDKKAPSNREIKENLHLAKKLKEEEVSFANHSLKVTKKAIKKQSISHARIQKKELAREERLAEQARKIDKRDKEFEDRDRRMSLKKESEQMKLLFKEQDKKDRRDAKRAKERHDDWLKLKAKMANASPLYEKMLTKNPVVWRPGEREQGLHELEWARKEVKREERLELEERERLRLEKHRAAFREKKKQEEQLLGKWVHRYPSPAWPFSALPYKQNDLIGLSGAATFASQGYTSSGKKQDISKIIFTNKDIKIQDILEVSKLVKDLKLDPIGGSMGLTNHFLYFLADEKISFDASMQEYAGSFDYARRIDDTFSLGFQIPFVHRENKLNLQANLSAEGQSKLNLGTTVTAFPSTLSDYRSFVIEVLARKGIGVHPKNTSTGLGNITLFGTAHIKTNHAKNLVLGIKAELPTTRDRDILKLWDAQTGKEFAKVSGFMGMLYEYRSYINPHIYLQGSYNVAASVDRRVARRRSYNGTSGGTDIVSGGIVSGSTDVVSATADTITTMQGTVYADKVRYKTSTPFDVPDSTVTRFETGTSRVKIHPGPEINFRAGNLFTRALSKRFEVDTYYDFRAKARDWVSSKLSREFYSPQTLVDRTYEVEHLVGLLANYHIDERFILFGGGSYTFAGRNVAESFRLFADLRIEF